MVSSIICCFAMLQANDPEFASRVETLTSRQAATTADVVTKLRIGDINEAWRITNDAEREFRKEVSALLPLAIRGRQRDDEDAPARILKALAPLISIHDQGAALILNDLWTKGPRKISDDNAVIWLGSNKGFSREVLTSWLKTGKTPVLPPRVTLADLRKGVAAQAARSPDKKSLFILFQGVNVNIFDDLGIAPPEFSTPVKGQIFVGMYLIGAPLRTAFGVFAFDEAALAPIALLCAEFHEASAKRITDIGLAIDWPGDGSINGDHWAPRLKAIGERLWTKLPRENVGRVVISPSADLWLVPFPAMVRSHLPADVTPADGKVVKEPTEAELARIATALRYWIDDSEIVYAFTARDFISWADEPKIGGQIRDVEIFGVPKYGNRSRAERASRGDEVVSIEFAGFHHRRTTRKRIAQSAASDQCDCDAKSSGSNAKGVLHCTESFADDSPVTQQMRSLASDIDTFLKGAMITPTVKKDGAATDSAFKNLRSKKAGESMLVVITHGCFLGSQGNAQGQQLHYCLLGTAFPRMANLELLSEIDVRTISNAAVDNGVLTGAEIVRGADLTGFRATWLVACQSGLGAIQGENVAAMRYACTVAGVDGVVASGWNAHIGPTSKLIDEMLRAYVATGRSAQALRSSMLSVKGSRRFRHPVLWSVFSYTGNPDR